MRLNTIAFRVFPSPETNDYEVKIFIDDQDFIAKHWPDMMGMDPEDLLSYDKLLPREEPHDATVVRCGCGVEGCGSAGVRVSAEGNRVVWDSWQGDPGNPSAPALVFDRDQYIAAVNDVIEDHSWESPVRTAARILKPLIDHDILARNRLKYQWAGQHREQVLTMSFEGPIGWHQILVHIPWHQQTPEEIAHEAARFLTTDPAEWSDVEWFGQSEKHPFSYD